MITIFGQAKKAEAPRPTPIKNPSDKSWTVREADGPPASAFASAEDGGP